MKRKCAILKKPEEFEIVSEELPNINPNEVLVEVEAIGLCHSDLPTYYGEGQVGFDGYGHLTMIKDIEYPTHIGHESVGVIKEVGSEVTNYKVGDYVGFIPAVSGFASHLIVPAEFCIPIPKQIKRDELKYCLVEPLMCVGNIVHAATPKLGETVAVVGCGMMGLLTIAGLKHSGASKIIAVDVLDERLQIARSYGATDTINPGDIDDITYCVDELTESLGVDIVVEITGNLKGLKTALKLVKYGELLESAGRGKILVPSLYAKEDKWDPEIGYELAFRAPIIHSVHPSYSEDYIKTAKDSIEGFKKGILPIRDFITHEFSLEEIQSAFNVMQQGSDGYLKGIIIP